MCPEPWLASIVEIGKDGRREYKIGNVDPGPDLLHIRYKSTTSSARGIGPLDAGQTRLVAAGLLQRYASRVIASGGVPYYVMKHPRELSGTQVADLQAQWYQSRMNALGMPAVMSGGVELEQLQMSPADMTLLELSQYYESRIAILLGVPPFLVGLPSGGDAMTYSNTQSLFDFHWRSGLRPKVAPVVRPVAVGAAGGTDIEVNKPSASGRDHWNGRRPTTSSSGSGRSLRPTCRLLGQFAIGGHTAAPTVPVLPAGVRSYG